MFVSASHELSQEYREFERCSTVAANAYVGPKVRRYIGEIDAHMRAAGFAGSFLVVQSTGGLYEAEQAQSQCVRMLESGPAAGVIGTQALCRMLGIDNAIAFDMGGTTAKAGVIYHGEALTTGAALIGGYEQALPVQIAMMDIFEVGTGGGSIARVDEEALRVGPQSAGAAPGPACYGLGGTEPTVTDANLVLGRLDADRFLGGEMKLDVAAAERALKERIGEPLGLSAVEAADGILRIAATAMSYAVKGVTTERGLDAGDFVLVAYGGAGPLHAVEVAREIGMRKVIVPFAPGVFSAFGMLFADLRYDFVRTCVHAARRRVVRRDRDASIGALEEQGREAIAGASVTPQRIVIKRAADMRYVGQEHAVTVDLPMAVFKRGDREAIKRHFDAMHAQRYGTSAPAERAEIVSLRSTVTGLMRKPPQRKIARGQQGAAGSGHRRQAQSLFRRHAFVQRRSFGAPALLAGNRIRGSGSDRGIRLDDAAAARRYAGGRCVRQSGDTAWRLMRNAGLIGQGEGGPRAYSARLVGSVCCARSISWNSRSSLTSAASSDADGATSLQSDTGFVPGVSARWLSSGKCCAYLLASSISRPLCRFRRCSRDARFGRQVKRKLRNFTGFALSGGLHARAIVPPQLAP